MNYQQSESRHHASRLSGATGQAAPKGFDPWILWVTFRRCWPWAIPVGTLLAGVVAILLIETFVPKYKAEHWLEASQDYLVFRGVMQSERMDLLETEKQTFYTPIVLDPVLSNPELRKAPSLSDPEKAESNLRRNLSVASGGTKNRLMVSYQDTDRVAAMTVCNAVVDSYIRARESFDNRRIENLVRWLEPEIRRMEQEVEERRLTVQTLSQSTLGYAPGQRLSVLEDQNSIALLSGLRSQITDMKVQLSLLDAEEKFQALLPDGQPVGAPFVPPTIDIQRREPTEAQILAAIEDDSAVGEARSKVDYLKSQILNLEVQDLVRFDRVRYQQLQKQREDAITNLEQARSQVRTGVEKTLNELADKDLERRKREAELQIASLEQQHRQGQNAARMLQVREREELEAHLKVLEDSYNSERGRLEQYGGESAKLQFAQEELALASGVLWKLRDRVTQIKTERQQDNAIRSLSVARVPTAPVESIPYKKLFAASGAAMLVPFLIGFLWEFKVQRVTDSTAMESVNLIPVVGEVAKLPTGSNSRRGRRLYEESVDTLRANLFLSMNTKDARTIAVVSSMSGEGKSSVASQLAISIAKATGDLVLLVDTDLRCPDQHEIFGLEPGQGLCGVLNGRASLEDAVDKSLGNLVHILPAGRLDRSPHRLMSLEAMQAFAAEARRKYQYVVFDTAPVLSAGETLAVAAVADVTLLCVMRDVSRMENVTRTTRRLEAAGAKLAGTVFSGVTARQYAYRYGDYHYSAPAGDFVS